MPDNSGYFSDDDHKKIEAWVDEHSKGKYKCHCCSGQDFSIFSHLVQTSIATSSGPNLKTGYEAVGISCKNCGNISWFDADRIGVGTAAPYWDPVKDGGKDPIKEDNV